MAIVFNIAGDAGAGERSLGVGANLVAQLLILAFVVVDALGLIGYSLATGTVAHGPVAGEFAFVRAFELRAFRLLSLYENPKEIY